MAKTIAVAFHLVVKADPNQNGYCKHPPVVDSHCLQQQLAKGHRFIPASFQASVIPVVKRDQHACGEFEPEDQPPLPRRPFRVILRERQGGVR